MEEGLFPKLADLLEAYVEVRLDTDPGRSEHTERFNEYQLRLTRSQARPTYVIVDPEKPDVPIDIFAGAELSGGGKEFAAFLRRNAK
jgi:hypothetical protein